MDELDRRLRQLAEAAPAPDPARKQQARAQLLALAEAERRPAQASQPVRKPGGLWQPLGRRWVPALAAAAAVAAAVVAGGVLSDVFDRVGDDGAVPQAEPEPAPEPGPGQEPAPADADDEPRVLAARCADPDGHYTIGYPQGWHTQPDGECRRFDQTPVEIEGQIGSAGPLAAIELEVVDTPHDQLANPGDATLLAETRDPADGSFEARRETLDEMMATIDLAPEG